MRRVNGGSEIALLNAAREMADPHRNQREDIARKIVADNIDLPREEIGRLLIEAGITRSSHMGPSLAIAAYESSQREKA